MCFAERKGTSESIRQVLGLLEEGARECVKTGKINQSAAMKYFCSGTVNPVSMSYR